MSFLTVVEQDLQTDATAALNAGKELLNYVDGVFTTDLIPALETALQNALKVLEQDAIAALLSAGTPTAAPPSA